MEKYLDRLARNAREFNGRDSTLFHLVRNQSTNACTHPSQVPSCLFDIPSCQSCRLCGSVMVALRRRLQRYLPTGHPSAAESPPRKPGLRPEQPLPEAAPMVEAPEKVRTRTQIHMNALARVSCVCCVCCVSHGFHSGG